MTLSHCWGRVNHLTLTKATYADLRSGIPLTRLRRLFQDAIYCARNLGARYLWIDALCIFQDKNDLSDWNREAPAMQHVYSNSLCNISAVDAPDGTHPLFHTREASALPSTDADGEPEQLVFHDDQFWQRQVSRAVLHTRAWVVQERLLAPRVLHFGAQQILWECAELNAAETYPEGLPDCIPTGTGKGSLEIPSSSSNDDDGTALFGPEQALDAWSEVVRVYTLCNLTQPGDKLVACAGLAKRIAAASSLSSGQYVAGLWLHQLQCQLLWEVAANPFPRRRRLGDTSRPAVYRAPSWSWASVDGPVNLSPVSRGPRTMTLVGVTDVCVENEGGRADPFGAVRRAEISLRGTLRPIEILEPYRDPNSRFTSASRIRLRGGGGASAEEEAQLLDQHSFSIDVVQPHFRAENAAGELYMMAMALAPQAHGRDMDMYFLLLQVVDRARGAYRRIGVARWWMKESTRERQEELLLRFDEQREAPCVEFSDMLYTIVVV